MLSYPPKPVLKDHYNGDYYERRWQSSVNEIDESLQVMETLRMELGNEVFKMVNKHADLIRETLQRKEFFVNNAKLRYELSCASGPNDEIHKRINEPLKNRREWFSNRIAKQAKKCIEKIINTTCNKNGRVTRNPDKPYRITAECDVGGWGNSNVDYEANVPKDWHNSPACKVAELFGHKFFPLECRREPELDRGDMEFYWVNRATRTTKVGFNPPETGYAVVNSFGFTGWGTTPEAATKSLVKSQVRAAKKRLLATTK